ncbi:Uncharacterized protein TCM_005282 [Theobroma cacao]|uniref:Uncharacterized protein n=1 Tax=Theobroma cacao TaxID=3641 RepID=A0A061DT35_THECC|nr:Uncharacterized protein TCM_005282 [Theobroma cacao]
MGIFLVGRKRIEGQGRGRGGTHQYFSLSPVNWVGNGGGGGGGNGQRISRDQIFDANPKKSELNRGDPLTTF